MDPLTVLFFGPQGAGKGTQVEYLIRTLKERSENHIIHIEMGQLLRNMVASDTYTGKLVHEVISVGGLMPDFMPVYLMSKMLVEEMKTGEEHMIADGVTRRTDQTHGFDEAMLFYGRGNYQIIALELSEQESIKRLLLRGRNDDTEDAIKKRLAWHHAEVEPQLDLLASRGRTIHRINGERSIDEVHADVLARLGL